MTNSWQVSDRVHPLTIKRLLDGLMELAEAAGNLCPEKRGDRPGSPSLAIR